MMSPTQTMSTATAAGLVNTQGQFVTKATIRVTYRNGIMVDGEKRPLGDIVEDLDMSHALQFVCGAWPKAEFVDKEKATKRGPGRPRTTAAPDE